MYKTISLAKATKTKKDSKDTTWSLFGSPNWARTSDIMINSHALYRLSYGGMYPKQVYAEIAQICFGVGVFLSSRAVTSQVLSALMSLTSVFGMGTGGPSSLTTPTNI